MSSYLNLYLLPKKREGDTAEPKPLLLNSWSRSTNVYQTFYEELSPAFIGIDGEPNYTEVSEKSMDSLISSIKEGIQKAEDRLKSTLEIYQKLTISDSDVIEECVSEYSSQIEYIKNLKDNLSFFEVLSEILFELKYSDFEKILINID